MKTTTPATGGQRYAFIDLLRGMALIVMVETHVVNAYLPLAGRKSSFFFWLSFVNGLVAPAFLFASGFSIVLQARRQWQNWLRLSPVFWKQIRRLGFIFIVAYFLHLPHFGLSKFLVSQGQAFWKSALQVDVLQCIVVSLLAIDGLILLTRKQALFVWAAASLGVGAALVTPWVWAHDFTGHMPLFLAMFLNPHGVSLFPVFPWISFVMAGSCAGHLFLNAVAKQRDAGYMGRALLISLAAIVAALAVRQLPLFSAWNVGFYKTSPLYVVIRFACVMILCAGFYFMEKRLGWIPGAIRLAGQESLLVYCAHLMLIFSVLRQPRVASILGREAGYVACFLLSIALILLMLVCARIWHGWKRDHSRLAKMALWAVVGISAIIFVLR
ncbi:MAG: heparan-alpha-glucosaminide N-acetyltransferase domain-containing protein [Acidobacteriota bacterium]|jgi:uncharacterized membrane protein